MLLAAEPAKLGELPLSLSALLPMLLAAEPAKLG
jgi:hypothetical protein